MRPEDCGCCLIDILHAPREEDNGGAASFLAMLMKQEGVIYSDPSLIELLRLNLVGLNVINLSDHPIDPAGAEKPDIDTIVARLDKLPEELEFLRLPRSSESLARSIWP